LKQKFASTEKKCLHRRRAEEDRGEEEDEEVDLPSPSPAAPIPPFLTPPPLPTASRRAPVAAAIAAARTSAALLIESALCCVRTSSALSCRLAVKFGAATTLLTKNIANATATKSSGRVETQAPGDDNSGNSAQSANARWMDGATRSPCQWDLGGVEDEADNDEEEDRAEVENDATANLEARHILYDSNATIIRQICKAFVRRAIMAAGE
jgi:hypothetical protein